MTRSCSSAQHRAHGSSKEGRRTLRSSSCGGEERGCLGAHTSIINVAPLFVVAGSLPAASTCVARNPKKTLVDPSKDTSLLLVENYVRLQAALRRSRRDGDNGT